MKWQFEDESTKFCVVYRSNTLVRYPYCPLCDVQCIPLPGTRRAQGSPSRTSPPSRNHVRGYAAGVLQGNAVLEMGAQGLEPAQCRIALGFPQRGEAVRWGIALRTVGHGALALRNCWQSFVSERWYDIILHEGAFNVQLSHGNCPHRIRPLLHR